MPRYANHPSEWVGYHQFPGQTGSFEVFYDEADGNKPDGAWYWWACFPGCLPDGDPSGPFQTAKAAYSDAMGGVAMPWYDVGYLEYSSFGMQRGELPPKRGWVKTPALSAREALEQWNRHKDKIAYSINNDSIRVTSGKVTKLKNEWDTRDRDYWRGKWRDAIAAMPYKIISNWTIEWLPQPKGETPLPAYIKGRAKGKMKIIDGQVHKLTKTAHSTRPEGAASNLAILLGYITWTGADHKRKRANSCAMLGRKIPESSRPRSAAARAMLANVGKMSHAEIKIMLAQKRQEMNR